MAGFVAFNDKIGIKYAARVVLLLLLCLLAGSVLYYKERMLFIDAPHVFFRIVNDRKLHIEEHRVGSFITQLVPLLGAWLHLPFKLLLVLYSASFYMFYLGAAIVMYRLKSYRLLVLFGLYLVLFVSDTYYWPNNEVHQGIAWLMLAFAVNGWLAARTSISVIAFILLFALAIWTHPLVMFVALFLWFFMWIGNFDWPYSRKQSIVYCGILILLAGLKYYQGSSGGYDGTKIEVVTHLQASRLQELYKAPLLLFFSKRCLTNYWLAPFLLVAGLVSLLRWRKYLLFSGTVVIGVGYLALVCLVFWEVGSNSFYIESELMPMAVLCCAPFVFVALPKVGGRLAVAIMLVIGVVRLGYIYHAAEPFTERIKLEDQVLNKMRDKGLTKVMIPEPVPDLDSALIMNWGAPVESICLSHLRGERPQRTFLFASSGDIAHLTTSKDTILGCWELRGPAAINRHYFQVDTMSRYQVISYPSLIR